STTKRGGTTAGTVVRNTAPFFNSHVPLASSSSAPYASPYSKCPSGFSRSCAATSIWPPSYSPASDSRVTGIVADATPSALSGGRSLCAATRTGRALARDIAEQKIQRPTRIALLCKLVPLSLGHHKLTRTDRAADAEPNIVARPPNPLRSFRFPSLVFRNRAPIRARAQACSHSSHRCYSCG